MDKITKRNSYILLSVSVFCLIVLVATATYAYFTPIIEGDGTLIDLVAGKVTLEISDENVTLQKVEPILDTNKTSKNHTFTVGRTTDSNLNACYSLYLVVDELGSNFDKFVNGSSGDKFNKYLKYELDKDSQTVKTGTFADLVAETEVTDGESKYKPILLAEQQEINGTAKNSYTIRVWLSYDENVDQSEVLKGEDNARIVKAHIKASGQNGLCKKD